MVKGVAAYDFVTFGSYEQDNNAANGKEPVEWIVLSVEEKKALLISRYVLDCKKYNEVLADVTWETSSIRKWLNGAFLNELFSDTENNLLCVTNNVNDDNLHYGTTGGNATQDTVFLLSEEEVEKTLVYGTSVFTEYVKNNTTIKDTGLGKCDWWLRSPGANNWHAAVGASTGYLDWGNYVDDSGIGVRPAIWVDLSKV